MFDFLVAENEETALEQLHEMGCTDGLPVIIPTPERVTKSVLASGLDGDMVLGILGPLMGVATVAKVAAAAVMADFPGNFQDNYWGGFWSGFGTGSGWSSGAAAEIRFDFCLHLGYFLSPAGLVCP